MNKFFYHIGTFLFAYALLGVLITGVVILIKSGDRTALLPWHWLAITGLFSRSACVKEELDELRKKIEDDKKGA